MALRPTYEHPRAAEYRAPGGPWDLPSLDALLTGAALRSRGDLVVDESTGTRLDGAALEAMVARVAGGLAACGVGRGDVVAWQAPNWHEVVVLYRAVWRLGAIAAPVHHLAGGAEVDLMLGAIEPAMWLPGDEIRGPASRFAALLDGAPVSGSEARPEDLAVVIFTAGSTGGPKAALHTQRSLAYKAQMMAEVHGLHRHDVVLMPAPIAHVSGLLNGVLVPGAAPFTSYLVERWDTGRALDTIARERVSFMVGPTTFFVGLMHDPGFSPEKVASLALVSSGGGGVSAAFVEEASRVLGCRVKRTYGSTEAPTIATSRADDPLRRAAETDGRAIGAVALRATDPQSHREVATGEPGELWVQGPELFSGYAVAEQTAAVVTDGWFRTGDLATIDADGWLTIVGRIKDIIIRGGENISAAEVEHTLEAHPRVKQAVAVGYPDDRLGERVCAFVLAAGPFDLDACRAWFAQQGVARFKTPERVIVLDAFPLLAAGKPDRNALRARAARP
ncbi:MAG: class I adenylate-forming enzyme family protein [Actinomycetota bacterium]